MPPPRLDVIYEDNHLLAVNKPAGLPTMGVAAGVPSVVSLAKQYIKHKYQKPGNVYLGIMSRLDAGSSGIVLLARTSKAAARLTEQFRTRTVRKTYWAIVASGDCAGRSRAGRLGGQGRSAAADDRVRRRRSPGQGSATCAIAALRSIGNGALVEIELLTGRKHQIRLQLAARGYPIWGEQKYGQGAAFADRHRTARPATRRDASDRPTAAGTNRASCRPPGEHSGFDE